MLRPAVAEAAARAGAAAIGLVDVGSAGLNLAVDRVGITYDNGQFLGDPASTAQVSCSVVGDRPLPTRPMPEVVVRVGVARDPGAVADAEVTLAGTAPPRLLRGGPLELLPDALALVPAQALPVVTTTWAVSRIPPEPRHRFVRLLAEAGAERTVVWVSVEGVGVAPMIPTLGDRPASGHSIIGLAVFDGSARPPEALGRCWSRGRWMSWLAPPR